jgi:methionyl-tRNA synthetase
MADRFYITTPIYYPNGEPHIGHVYTTIVSDALARYHRLKGDDTFFLTGTDEHGIKMVKTAAEQGLEPKALADLNAAVFRDVWKEFRITNDYFIRTTDPLHKAGVETIVRKLVASGDIYLGSYEGWYDEGQEEFVTETDAKENGYKSAISGRPLTRYSEPTYFFRLSKYVDRVLAHIESHPHFIQPEARRNEVVSKLKQGVDDLSVSRGTLKWGIPMPHDPAHVVYVWIDALSNYITALGYGTDDDSNFRRFWPANVHVIGKDIMWFHTVYWPAMLFALGLEPPEAVVAHGWFMSGGRKMGKTLGNFVDLPILRKKITDYSLDALRYFLLRGAVFGSDPDWNELDFTKSFNELANVLGNCLNRTVKMVGRYRPALPAAGEPFEPIDQQLRAATDALPGQIESAYAKFELQQCALLPIELLRTTNGYIDATEPFKLAKDPAKAARLDTVLNLSAQAIYRALVALLPIIPDKAAEGLRQLGVATEGRTLAELFASPLPAGHKLGEATPLFPKLEKPPAAG